MKHSISTVAAGISLLTFAGIAAAEHGFIDKARVIHAEALYETVEVAHPVTECWDERVTRRNVNPGNYIAPIAGGLVGGLVGHQFGNGRGKTALTIVGTLLGASVGHEVGRSHHRHHPRVETVRRCETVDRYEQQQQLSGYRVKYRYEGQTYYTRTAEHPGKFIPVRVKVSPATGI